MHPAETGLLIPSGKRRNRPFEVLELEFRISNETNPGAQSLLIKESLKEWHELDRRGVVALKNAGTRRGELSAVLTAIARRS
jgi:hypothetical protein